MTLDEQFDIFWKSYPKRVGKKTARKAFAIAITEADLPTMLRAIDEYIMHKPGWQDFKHPATWLNSGGWDDEWAAAPKTGRRTHTDAARDFIDELNRPDGNFTSIVGNRARHLN